MLRAAVPFLCMRVILLSVAITLGGCDDRGSPASAYSNWKDQLVVAAGLRGFFSPCYRKENHDGVTVYARMPIDQCYRMDPPRRWRGIWRNDFEGSQFCPAPATQCSYNSPGDQIWLAMRKAPDQTLYAVDFIGRRTTVKGRYGHMGASDHELIVDRMISMRPIKEPADVHP